MELKLKESRKKHGFSQEEIAKKLNISQSNYSKYERGDIEPNINTLIQLSNFYKITLDDLVGHEVPYLIDKSLLSEKQLNVINLIQKLNDYQCDKVESFIMGLSMAELERKQTIENFNKGE